VNCCAETALARRVNAGILTEYYPAFLVSCVRSLSVIGIIAGCLLHSGARHVSRRVTMADAPTVVLAVEFLAEIDRRRWWTQMRKVKVMVGALMLGVIAAALLRRPASTLKPLKIVYADARNVTLWSSTAEVREPVATLTFGDRLSLLDQIEGEAEVRTAAGATGWVKDGELLPAVLWERGRALARTAERMPVDAIGHTAVLTNVHLEPGRQMPCIDQFTRGVSVELLAREPVALETSAVTKEEEVSTVAPAPAKMEDWWLVVARTRTEGTVAGWVLGRFLDLDSPAPLAEYASATGMRIVSWLVLNQVEGPDGTEKPQYLVLGATGREGQVCDFTELRVYTWGVDRHEYETAFVGGNVCGRLPVRLQHTSATDLTFSFRDLSGDESNVQTYRMQQTIVRRVGSDDRASRRKRSLAVAT